MINKVSGPVSCPSEDIIEGWAIQDVMRKDDKGKNREHLEHCAACNDLHMQFVNFYHEMNNEAGQFLVTRKTCTTERMVSMEGRIEPIVQAMKPFAPATDSIQNPMPVAFSRTLISEDQVGKERDKPFVSTDGTVFGRFLSGGNDPELSFQLLSPDTRFVRRALVHLPEDDSFYQSDDSGTAPLFYWSGLLQDIRFLEIVPYLTESVYTVQGKGADEILADSVELDGGVLGRIVVEQEECDGGESVLHVEMAGLSRSTIEHRVIIALTDGRHRNLIEEAVGRDVYMYGPDLLRDFRLWVYIC